MKNDSENNLQTPKRAWDETVQTVRERARNYCEQCNKPEGLCLKIQGHWQTIHLSIYHKDGNYRNNDLTNLAYLCPVCIQKNDEILQRKIEERAGKERRSQLSFDFESSCLRNNEHETP